MNESFTFAAQARAYSACFNTLSQTIQSTVEGSSCTLHAPREEGSSRGA